MKRNSFNSKARTFRLKIAAANPINFRNITNQLNAARETFLLIPSNIIFRLFLQNSLIVVVIIRSANARISKK